MILLYLQYKDGQNKQSAATFVHISQDGGYIGIGWKGNISVFLKNSFLPADHYTEWECSWIGWGL